MAQAQVGNLVKVHYTGRLADGTIFDTSMEREPLEFTLGEGELIPGFEQAVLGMATGESKTETILADQAYGPHHTERVIDVERHHLPPDLQPELGQQLQMTRPDGTTIPSSSRHHGDTVNLDADIRWLGRSHLRYHAG
jgi:FKBP-type peptidyl-prolyl cis-trans isomerase 2